jgi:integrase
LLTIDEVIAELRVSRAAFYRWRRQGAGPAVVRLPGGGVRVRWAVDGREHCKSFKGPPLADGFLTGLKGAVRDRRPFNPRTGLPEAETTEEEMITWYEHARAYAEAKWPTLAPVSRRSMAEALVTVTIALTTQKPGGPEPRVLRQALFAWAFNPATRQLHPPPEIADALGWAERASLPVADLEDTAIMRLALAACAKTLTGKAAAGSTQRRKRSVFYNALGYAVEQGHLPSNPVDRIQLTTPAVAQTVDGGSWSAPPRPGPCWLLSVACPAGGEHLEAFYACLHYAALRPSEAVMLRESDLHLPKKGWGRIVLAASASRAGMAWTDQGTARQERGLKHRAAHETRTIPIPPELVKLLRAPHQAVRHHPGRADLPDRPGRHPPGFGIRRGVDRGPQAGPHPGPVPVAARPAPLRLAARGGVDVAELWGAGDRGGPPGVAVLLKIYAHCIDGRADAANKRITDALGTQDARPESEPGDEGDDDSEQAS